MALAASPEVIETNFKNPCHSSNDQCSMNATMNDLLDIELFIAKKATTLLRATPLHRCHISKIRNGKFLLKISLTHHKMRSLKLWRMVCFKMKIADFEMSSSCENYRISFEIKFMFVELCDPH